MTDTSLLDDLRKILASKTITKETARRGNFRSCEQCSFYKNGYCTQTQPPSKILNVYEAQICIYYTPETATTGTMTTTERATQASQLDLIKRINLVDLITTISLIDLITRIALVDNITNVGTLNLVNTINLIKSIASIDTIANIQNIEKIGSLDVGFVRINPIQNPRFTSGLDGWRIFYPAHAVVEDDATFGKHVKLVNMSGDVLKQYVVVDSNEYTFLVFYAYKPSSGGSNISIKIFYTDGSDTLYEPSTSVDVWVRYVLALDNNKIMSAFHVYQVGGTGITYFAFPQLVHSNAVAQATRTSLKVQTEREDLLTQPFERVSVGAEDYAILTAVDNKKHKVFAVNYESNADIDVSLRFGTGNKFFRRAFTKGVYAHTLTNPIIGAVNTALNLRVEGAVTTNGFVQYVTEA
jgi:hypothetical protein